MMHNRKFIRLHSVDDNTVAGFVTSEIMYVITSKYEDGNFYTTIGLMNGKDEFAVNESVDKIYNLIKECGFVRCHKSADNSVELFNIDSYVMHSVDQNNQTVVSLKQEIDMSINETPERIYNALIAAQNGNPETSKNGQP